MTTGQVPKRYRQVRTTVLVGALAVTFGVGLLGRLVVPRTIGQTAQAAGDAGVVASSTGGGILGHFAPDLILRGGRPYLILRGGRPYLVRWDGQ